MTRWVVRTFGLHGSWRWACRKLDSGHIVYRTTDTVTMRLRLDSEGQRRIVECFDRYIGSDTKWVNASIFLSDFECTSWDVLSFIFYKPAYNREEIV